MATDAPRGKRAPTVRQIYALARELCERMGEEFPETRDEASAVIERLRIENGHPAPTLEDALREIPRPRRRRRWYGPDGLPARRSSLRIEPPRYDDDEVDAELR